MKPTDDQAEGISLWLVFFWIILAIGVIAAAVIVYRYRQNRGKFNIR